METQRRDSKALETESLNELLKNQQKWMNRASKNKKMTCAKVRHGAKELSQTLQEDNCHNSGNY